MKHQFITIIPLLLVAFICFLHLSPNVAFAGSGLSFLNQIGVVESRGTKAKTETETETPPAPPAPVETQPGVVEAGASGTEEPENIEGNKQAEEQTGEKDLQQYAAEQAERNQRDIEAGRPTPDRPATPANLANFQQERAKTEQEDQQTQDAKRSAQFNAQNEAGDSEGQEG